MMKSVWYVAVCFCTAYTYVCVCVCVCVYGVCACMCVCACQLVEKAIEHNTKVFLLFADLCKAYDSVPRSAMWSALQKYGVPDVTVDLVRGLHEHMEAKVSVAGESAWIQVSNGLRQGCVLAPTLFLLYFNMVMLCWRARCAGLGVKLLYKCGGKLVGERTRAPMSSLVTELCFADDAVITASTREDITKATVELQQVTAECGLTISFPKTKLMVAGRGIIESDVAPLCIGSSVVDTVPSFRYLGSVVESHGGVMLDLDDKIARASRAFGALQKPVFRDGSLSLVTKKVVYQAVVLGVLLYAAETWPAKQRDIRRLEGFHHRCLRSILGIGRMQQRLQHISNEKVRQWFGMPTSLEVTIACRRLQWLGHVARMEDSRLPKQFLFGWLSHPRPAHGVKLRWRDKVRRDLKTFHINENTWYALAHDRQSWLLQYTRGASQVPLQLQHNLLVCSVCTRSFRRPQDMARHNCDSVRSRLAAARNV